MAVSADAPAFRVWPPVALGVPWLAGYALTAALVPVGFALLWWGAVRPEELYLSERFGAEYDDYRRRVRRWL